MKKKSPKSKIPNAVEIHSLRDGRIAVSLGETTVNLSADEAYDLQFRLATVLAERELEDYPEEEKREALALTESRETLRAISGVSFTRDPNSFDA